MKINVVLSDCNLNFIPKELILNLLDGLNFHSSRMGWEINKVYSKVENLNLYSEILNLNIEIFDKNELGKIANLLLLGGYVGNWKYDTFLEIGVENIYIIDWMASIRVLSSKDSPVVIDKTLDSHIFNKLGPPSHTFAFDFYHFPYGYLYRDASWGDINQFGHRINFDFKRLKTRSKQHKVIACFGGSAAWGWGCLSNRIWTYYLEQKLNKAFDGSEFTVLNFAQPGNVVLNEIMHYILFVNDVKPDFVISLSGANDLYNGQASDEYLLENFDITYQQNLERWSVDIHKNFKDAPLFDHSNPKTMLSKNQPLAVINSYISRIRQFKELSLGTKFIWGLQPMTFGRMHMHDYEREFMGSWNKYDDKEIQNRNVHLYNTVINSVPNDLADSFVDCHTILSGYDSSKWHYWDVVHPSPKGHLDIANIFFDHISSFIKEKK